MSHRDQTTETPAWLVPGAPVVVVTKHSRHDVITRTTIEKVTAKAFTITDTVYGGKRFTIASMGRRASDVWGPSLEVVQAGSNRGRELLATEHRRVLANQARSACDTWVRDQTDVNRRAAITALQALEETTGE